MLKLLFVPLLLLSACSTTVEPKEVIGSVEKLYNEGMDDIQAGRFSKAIITFEELERQHPYSGWATRAQMMVSYAHYRRGEYDEAIINAERFIRLHPGYKDLDYMYYIRGLAFYDRISDVRRDQGMTLEALNAFEEIVSRFPSSVYARDAKMKITLCNDHLAGKEMSIGRFYLAKGRYLAAINRFRTVVENYERTAQTPEALYRLSEAYLALGLDDEAKVAAAVLGHNFPNSSWYNDAYNLLKGKNLKPEADESSWLSKIF